MEIEKGEIVDVVMGFFRSKTLTASLELGVFDALEGGPASLQEICSRTGVPVHAGRRLLVALAAMRLIKKDGDRYALPPASREVLLRSSPEWLGWLARHVDRFLYPLWSRVADAVRQDGDQRQAVLGDPRSWFEILYQDPHDVQDFQAFLAIMARPFIEGLVRSFDFSPFRSFMDIGSGSGELPLAVAARHEKLELAVLELPEAAHAMRERMKTARHGERVRVLEGDVIAGNIPKGRYDLIHLGWMLHDYAPATQARILRNIHDALPPGGTFIASETPLDDDEAGPLFTSLLSLNMLVSTDGGGESTRREYVVRFQEAGFENVRVVSISGPRTLFLGERRRADRVEGA